LRNVKKLDLNAFKVESWTPFLVNGGVANNTHDLK
jgi:hypothetical protein